MENEKRGETPECLMRKALGYVPGIYLVLSILVGIAVICGILSAGIILSLSRIPLPIIVGAVVGVVGLLVAVFAALKQILFPDPGESSAMILDLPKHPRFEVLLRELAERTQTEMPDKVIVAASSEFSV